ncbi:MAG: hypothetical protein M3Y84_04905 [Acidobacteriota bacterium]|nr:hypothetical protein [Acidobacteriota bacterium]
MAPKKAATKKAGTKKAGTKKGGTKKAGTRKAPAGLNSILNFKIDWIKDPVPIFRRFLDPGTVKELESAKDQFKDRINGILRGAR